MPAFLAVAQKCQDTYSDKQGFETNLKAAVNYDFLHNRGIRYSL